MTTPLPDRSQSRTRNTARSFVQLRYAGRILYSTLPMPELPELSATDAQPAPNHLEIAQRTSLDSPVVINHHTWPDPAGNAAILGERWKDGRYCLRFPGIVDATIDPSGTRVEFCKAPGAGMDAVRHVLLDQVLPRAIASTGTLVLHCSAVITKRGQLLVFLGESGYGKSTLATAFDLYGGIAVNDDCLVVERKDQHIHGIPAYGGMRLWPDSMSNLLEHRRSDSMPMADYSTKVRVPPAVLTDHVATTRIAAFVVLAPPGDYKETTLTPLSPREGCMALVTNSFQLDPGNLRHTHTLLGAAADACKSLPALCLQHPRDYAELPNVVAYINRHFQTHRSD